MPPTATATNWHLNHVAGPIWSRERSGNAIVAVLWLDRGQYLARLQAQLVGQLDPRLRTLYSSDLELGWTLDS